MILIKLKLLKLLSRQEAISMFYVIIKFDLFKIIYFNLVK